MSETNFRPIDIDFEVYQLIVLEQRDFGESENDALRRLLGLDDSPPVKTSESWISHGVELPAGTELQMAYGGTEFRGVVTSKKWKIGKRYFNSPSRAASEVARISTGHSTSLNGWNYWYVKRPTDKTWVFLDKLRK